MLSGVRQTTGNWGFSRMTMPSMMPEDVAVSREFSTGLGVRSWGAQRDSARTANSADSSSGHAAFCCLREDAPVQPVQPVQT